MQSYNPIFGDCKCDSVALVCDVHLRVCSRLGHSGDVHSFTSVFGERPWLQLREPATAAFTMIQTFDPSSWRHSLGRHKAISASHKSNKSEGGTARDPNSRPGQTSLFQSLRVEMQMPLSAEGYRNLLQSIEK